MGTMGCSTSRLQDAYDSTFLLSEASLLHTNMLVAALRPQVDSTWQIVVSAAASPPLRASLANES